MVAYGVSSGGGPGRARERGGDVQLYNSMTGKVEPFAPADGKTVRMYVCGVTPYDTTHMGHAMTYLTFDVINRFCQYLGWRVKYVQNVTDIDDDTIRKAKEVGTDWLTLGNRWTRHFIEDMIALNVRPPDVYPRATDVIPQMFEIIDALLAKGHAYVANGSVYFEVATDPHFGQVSGLPKEQWLPIANERGNFPNDPNKRDPLDFVLWQAQQPGEPAWDSPWGPGRPRPGDVHRAPHRFRRRGASSMAVDRTVRIKVQPTTSRTPPRTKYPRSQGKGSAASSRT